MNVFVFRLLVNVRWRNAEVKLPKITEYANKLWYSMSDEERAVAAPLNN